MAIGRDDGERPGPALPLIPTTVIGSYPQPSWLVDHDLLVAEGRAPNAGGRGVAHPARRPRRGARRRHAARDPRSGPSRDRHRHRRRDPSRELLQPLRQRPRRRGPPAVGRGPQPRRWPVRGAAGRADRSAGRSPWSWAPAEFLRAATDRSDQGDRARPVHAQPAGPERALPGPARPGVGLRRRHPGGAGRPRRRWASTWCSSTSRTCRPTPTPPGASPSRPSIGPSPASSATTVLHTCYGYAVYVADKSGGYPFLAELADCRADQLAVEFAQPRLDPAVLAPVAARRSCSVCSTCRRPRSSRPGHRRPVARRPRRRPARSPRRRARLRDEVPAPSLAYAKLEALVEGAAQVRREL